MDSAVTSRVEHTVVVCSRSGFRGGLGVLWLALTCALLAGLAGPALAATYYVDAATGNDAWSGTASVAAATDGPWRSLAKVQGARFLPGDAVLLKCGQAWRETLVLQDSGTAANPISIGTYPAPCSTPPLIDGSVDVPAENWTLHAGRIYKARLPLRMIGNGTFDADVAGWVKWSPNNDAALVFMPSCTATGAGCLGFAAGVAASILSSKPFLLLPVNHQLSVSLKVPSGKSVRLIVRRNAAPWDVLGLITSVAGNGGWQTFGFSFRGTAEVSNARLDVEVPAGVAINMDNVALDAMVGTPSQLLVQGRLLMPARHPNPGFNSTRPLSPYFLNAQDSDQVVSSGVTASTYLTTGSDLQLPPGATIGAGTRVRVRTNAWNLDERTVAGVVGNRLVFDLPLSGVLKAEWGYLFEGALWMLDQPGEWYYDAPGGYLYAWMPDGAVPGNRVALSRLDVGIDVAGKSNLIVDGLAVRRTRLGVRMRDAANVVLRNLAISDTLDQGADVAGSTASSIESSSFARTGRDAIFGADIATGHIASGLKVTGNRIVDSGVRLENGKVVSLPVKSFAAVFPGHDATVSGNSIVNAGYNGILPGANSLVEANYIENACTVLDDGGAIYLGGVNNHSVIRNNLIWHVPGAVEGKPGNNSRGQGIFVDELGSGVTLSGNTVIDAEFGFHLHNAANNLVQGNTLYGNRRYQLWLEESSRTVFPDGDVRGNRISGNTMVPTSAVASVYHRTDFSSTEQFATYDGNLYSTLLSPLVAAEETVAVKSFRTLPQWQTAMTAGGVPRSLDLQGREVSAVGSARFRVTGANVIPNGNFATSLAGWVSWNETAPLGVQARETCTVGPCLRYSAGGTAGLVLSPFFSVAKDVWYRLAFDMRASVNDMTVHVGVQRSGGGSNGYEWLMSEISPINSSSEWKRYVIVFQATKTVNAADPVTLDLGARLDFVGVTPGNSLWLANVEMVPATPVGSVLRTNVLVNPARVTASVACPDTGTDATLYCSRYVRFADGVRIGFPYSLGPLGSEIIYSIGDTLIDADGDGVGDVQDSCPNTPAGAGVNARGCAIGQAG